MSRSRECGVCVVTQTLQQLPNAYLRFLGNARLLVGYTGPLMHQLGVQHDERVLHEVAVGFTDVGTGRRTHPFSQGSNRTQMYGL